jgi:hypothetical protein
MLEKSGNFLKFLLVLTFQNVNLDRHSCMAKCTVSILAPFDFV